MKLSSPFPCDEEPETRWYARREGVTRGPFSANKISGYILLGRIRLDDELSRDGMNWSLARHLTGLLPGELESQSGWEDYQRLVIAHMKADERNSERRSADSGSYPGLQTERRAGTDRRREGPDPLLRHYLFGGAIPVGGKRPDARRARVLLLVMLLSSLLFVWLNPSQQ